jgi:hypothetical protein
MRHLFTYINAIIFLLGMIIVKQTKAQTGVNCASAINLSITPGQSTGWQSTSYDTIWYKFTAINNRANFDIKSDLLYAKQLSNVLISDNCSSGYDPAQVFYKSDSISGLFYQNLSIGNTYYIGLIFNTNISCTSCSISSYSYYLIDFISSAASYTGCTNNSICSSTPPCEYICNGSFEIKGGDNSGVPQFIWETEKACGWKNANTASVNYLHTASSNAPVSIPNNNIGCESERTGHNAYMSIGQLTGTQYQGALLTKLKSTLIYGQTYKISFYLSSPEIQQYIPINGIGFAFATNYVPSNVYYNFGSMFGQTNINTSNVTKAGWTYFSYNYIANGTETDFIIGNLITTTSDVLYTGPVTCNMSQAPIHLAEYFYLDDVSIISSSLPPITSNSANVCQYAPTTLIASGADTYTWQPGGSNVNPLIITPSVTSTYSVSGTDTYGCITTQQALVTVIPSPTISVTASQSTLSCLGESTTLTATGGINYTWSPCSSGCNANTYVVTPNQTTTYTVTGGSTNGCTNYTLMTINVPPPPIINIIATSATCPGTSYTLSTVSSTSYTWLPSGATTSSIVVTPTTSTIYSVVTTNSIGCISMGNIVLNQVFCCSQGSTLFTSTSGLPTSGIYYLNSPIVLTGNLILSNTTIFMGTNAEIIVPNNMTLELRGTHLLGCPNMWKGIRYTGTSGSIIISSNTLIEDALTAIDLKNVVTPSSTESLILNVSESTFNKNFTSINLENYLAGGNYPSSISGCVFTCRNLITDDHTIYLSAGATTYNWNTGVANTVLKNSSYIPSTPSSMSSGINVNVGDEFSVASYSPTTLGSPHVGETSRQGILLNNVNGPSFSGLSIGAGGATYSSLNLFDNMGMGIYAINSNLYSSNAAYQYMKQYAITSGGGLFPTYYYFGGAGIKMETNLPNVDNKLTVLPASSSGYDKSGNFFFHNSYGIFGTNLHFSNIQYAMIHSNRIYSSGVISTNGEIPKGEHGVYISTANYPNIKVDNNYITNINTGISFYTNGAYDTQAYGNVSIQSNYLQSDYTGNPTNRSVGIAIVADNLFNCAECIADDDSNPILVNYNIITNAFRGIKSSNWKHKVCYAANNTIVLNQEPNGFRNSLTTQYGILHENNYKDVINNNLITGFGTGKATVYAIKASDNGDQQILCNSTASTYEGFSFTGAQNTVSWYSNTMQSHVRGMHINNTIIGQQGYSGAPSSNVWSISGAGWSGSNFQTYVTSSAAGTSALNSKLYVKNNTSNNPVNNDGTPTTSRYILGTTLFTTTGFSPYECSVVLGRMANLPSGDERLGEAMLKIVTDSVPYENFAENKQVSGKQAVYGYMAQNASIAENNDALQEFYEQAQRTNLERLVEVEKQLALSDLGQAKAVNGTIISENLIEENRRLLYELYIKIEKGNYSNVDNAALLSLAGGCPDRDGAAVYQARVLYNSLYKTFRHFEDSCSANGSNNRKTKDNDAGSAQKNLQMGIEVYPNPTEGTCLINLGDLSSGSIILKVYDINGKLVYEEPAHPVNSKVYELHLELCNGMYLLEVTDTSTELHYKQKLVINR